ncbi:hypothetical protein HQN87_03590 [Paenibacillus tritici]|uniref:Uncharacterized protein n=1 Tax=Paenibacillus tritici TaxID=1873425 RepID=A0ABX2DLS1_9BACL|nr:hypothetical protein [Paenibacillus tritici]NQX44406.1 hypothetical protein [Paenibacillus tritici]
MKKLKSLLVILLIFTILPVKGAFANIGPGVVYIDFGPNGQNVNTFKLEGSGTGHNMKFYNLEGIAFFSTPTTGLSLTGNYGNYSAGNEVIRMIEITLDNGAELTGLNWTANNGSTGKVTMISSTNPLITPTPTKTPEPTPSVTPEAPSGSRAILTLTLITGDDKEFDLSMSEVTTFLAWYDSASGSARHGIDKHGNIKGPFSKRTEYVIHDKILTFEVSEYTAQ